MAPRRERTTQDGAMREGMVRRAAHASENERHAPQRWQERLPPGLKYCRARREAYVGAPRLASGTRPARDERARQQNRSNSRTAGESKVGRQRRWRHAASGSATARRRGTAFRLNRSSCANACRVGKNSSKERGRDSPSAVCRRRKRQRRRPAKRFFFRCCSRRPPFRSSRRCFSSMSSRTSMEGERRE